MIFAFFLLNTGFYLKTGEAVNLFAAGVFAGAILERYPIKSWRPQNDR
jgi:hypothetical protein